MNIIWELGSVRRHPWNTGDNILAVFQKSTGLVRVDFFGLQTAWYQPFGLLRIHKEPWGQHHNLKVLSSLTDIQV